MDRMGVPTEHFGDSTGHLTGLDIDGLDLG
jgi:hypothetical protein